MTCGQCHDSGFVIHVDPDTFNPTVSPCDACPAWRTKIEAWFKAESDAITRYMLTGDFTEMTAHPHEQAIQLTGKDPLDHKAA